MSDVFTDVIGPAIISALGGPAHQERAKALLISLRFYGGERYGKTISADTASKIQGAIDKMTAASDAHKNAVKQLATLVNSPPAKEPGRHHDRAVDEAKVLADVEKAVKSLAAYKDAKDEMIATLMVLVKLQPKLGGAVVSALDEAFTPDGTGTFVNTHKPKTSAGSTSLSPSLQDVFNSNPQGPPRSSREVDAHRSVPRSNRIPWGR